MARTEKPDRPRWQKGGAIVAGVLVLGALVYFFVLTERYKIPSESMEPTYEVGDTVSVSRFFPDTSPEVGDVVLFHPPVSAALGAAQACDEKLTRNEACEAPAGDFDEDQTFIKRVVAVGGDEIYFDDGQAIRNGEPLDAGWETVPCGNGAGCDLEEPVTIPPDHFFVVGDKLGASADSRVWGPVPQDEIVAIVN